MQRELTHLGSLGTELFWVCENPDGSVFPMGLHRILCTSCGAPQSCLRQGNKNQASWTSASWSFPWFSHFESHFHLLPQLIILLTFWALREMILDGGKREQMVSSVFIFLGKIAKREN